MGDYLAAERMDEEGAKTMTTDKTALDADKIKTIFENILTIDSQFESAGYSGDNVTLKISDLARFIRFYQPYTRPEPCGDAVEDLKSVLCDPEGKCCISGSDEDRRIIDNALAALTQPKAEGVYHSDPETSKEIEKFINKLPPELETPKANVEGLKREIFTALYPHHRYEPEHNPLVSLKDCIDHIAAQGYIGVPEWKPIETAPRDGSWVLLWTKGGYALPFFWGFDEDANEYCWFQHASHGQYAYKSKPKTWFTHWMPLPSAPKKEG